MGCGSTNSTTTNVSQPPQQYLNAYSNVLSQAQNVANQPLNQYPANQIVAPLNQTQQQALQQVAGLQGIQNPYINQASQSFGQATTPLWNGLPQFSTDQMGGLATQGLGYSNQAANTNIGAGGAAGISQANNAANAGTNGLGQYLNPYTQQVVNATQAEFNNQNAQQASALAGNAASEGAFGGDREAVAEGILGGQQQLAQAPTIAGIESQGYQQSLAALQQQQALQASTGLQGASLGQQALAQQAQLQQQAGTQQLGQFNTQQQAQLGAQEANAWLNSQAGFGYGNLGSEAQNLGLSGTNALLNAGNVLQNQTQQEMNVPYEQYLQQQAYPFQTTGWLSGVAEGTGSAAGGTSTTNAPNGNIISELAGLGIAGVGASQNSILGNILGYGGASAAGATAGAGAAAGGLDEASMLALGLMARGGAVHDGNYRSGGLIGHNNRHNSLPRFAPGGLIPPQPDQSAMSGPATNAVTNDIGNLNNLTSNLKTPTPAMGQSGYNPTQPGTFNFAAQGQPASATNPMGYGYNANNSALTGLLGGHLTGGTSGNQNSSSLQDIAAALSRGQKITPHEWSQASMPTGGGQIGNELLTDIQGPNANTSLLGAKSGGGLVPKYDDGGDITQPPENAPIPKMSPNDANLPPQAQAPDRYDAIMQRQQDTLARMQADRSNNFGLTPPENIQSNPQAPSMNRALMAAGLGMMAGTNPNALVNIGKGGLMGMQEYAGEEQRNRTEAMNQARIGQENQAAKQKYQATEAGLIQGQYREEDEANSLAQRVEDARQLMNRSDREATDRETQIADAQHAQQWREQQGTEFQQKLKAANQLFPQDPQTAFKYAASPYGAVGLGLGSQPPGAPGGPQIPQNQPTQTPIRPVGTNKPEDEIPSWSSPINGQSREQQAVQAKYQENAAAEIKKLDTDAQSAQLNHSDLVNLQTELASPNMTTGKLTPMKQTVAGYIYGLAQTYMPPDEARKMAIQWTGQDPSATEVFQKASTRMGLTFARQTEGAREAVQAIQIALTANPQLGNTVQGNQQIIKLMDAANRRIMDEQMYAQKWLSKNGDYVNFQSWWNQAHPMVEYTSRALPVPLPQNRQDWQPNVTYKSPNGKTGYWKSDTNSFETQ